MQAATGLTGQSGNQAVSGRKLNGVLYLRVSFVCHGGVFSHWRQLSGVRGAVLIEEQTLPAGGVGYKRLGSEGEVDKARWLP